MNYDTQISPMLGQTALPCLVDVSAPRSPILCPKVLPCPCSGRLPAVPQGAWSVVTGHTYCPRSVTVFAIYMQRLVSKSIVASLCNSKLDKLKCRHLRYSPRP